MRRVELLMRRVVRHSNINKYAKRRNTTAAGEPSTDEKASEISKEAWPTVKKYLPVIVPVLATTIYSVLVINNEKVKEWTEQYLPSYVNFIRTYHGFELENLEELNNKKATIANQMKPVNIVIKFHDGTEEFINVNGNESYEKLQNDILNKYNKDNALSVINISFKDDDDDDNNDKMIDSNIDSHIILDDIIMKRSLWDDAANTLEIESIKKNRLFISKANNFYNNTNHYNNVLKTIFNGLNQYLSLTNTRKLTIKTDTSIINIKSLKLNSNTIQKVEYNSNLDILTEQLKHLEWELKNGMKRSIEDVQEDIRKTNKEISNIRRKSSWFYWF